MNFLASIGRWILGAAVPMFAPPVKPVGLAWFVHIVLLAAASVGLFYAQMHFGLTEKIGKGPDTLRPFWLVILFLLAYSLAWATMWLSGLLAPRQTTAIYPDLDEAWDAIKISLEKAGIGLADTPVLLVLGELPSGYDALFRALPQGLSVNGGSPSGSPLRAYANRDAIYLTLEGATLLGIQETGEILLSNAPDQSTGGSLASIGAGASIGIGKSVGMSMGGSIGGGAGGALQQIQKLIQAARQQGRPLTDDEKDQIRQLSGSPEASPAASSRAGSTGSVLQNPQIVAETADRLAHVCNLVAGARWPLCPINGAILTIPISATDRDDGAQQWGLVARQDLAVIEDVFQLQFPVFALVGEAETLPGGGLFFERFALDKGNQRLGKSFPLNPQIPLENLPHAIEENVGWIFGNLLSYWSIRLTRTDSSNVAHDTRDNGLLVRFRSELLKRSSHLARLVSRAMTPGDRIPVFGGCYLSVILKSAPDHAKFARDFFKKVQDSQGYVAWTDEALSRDAGYRSRTMQGYVLLAVVILGVAAFAGWTIFGAVNKPGA